MKTYIMKEFSPIHRDVQSRYQKHGMLLSRIAKELKAPNLNEGKYLFQTEMFLLRMKSQNLL